MTADQKSSGFSSWKPAITFLLRSVAMHQKQIGTPGQPSVRSDGRTQHLGRSFVQRVHHSRMPTGTNGPMNAMTLAIIANG